VSRPDDPLPQSNKLDRDNPWPGLEGFLEENKKLFEGRHRETMEFFRLIKTEQLSVLYGKSGYGKSSLLRAGVFPELRRAGFVPIYIVLKHDEREPALVQQVKDEISRTITSGNIDAPQPRPEETLWEYFHRKDVEWWDKENNLLTPVLVFDQFEEVITVGRESPDRQRRADDFLTELENLAGHSTPEPFALRLEQDPTLAANYLAYGNDFKLVLALREDFLPELESLRERLKGVMTNRYRLLPMNGQQALQVVLKPAPGLVDEAVGIEIVDRVSRLRGEAAAPTAVDRKEIAKRSVEPALLSMLCSQLNRKRRELGLRKITPDLVGEAQVEAVLHEFYDRGMSVVAKELHNFVEQRLITASGARNRCAREDALLEAGISAEDIDKLIDARILRLDVSAGVVWLELTHDRLAEIAKANRDARAMQRENEQKLADAEARESRALQRLARSRRRMRRVIAGAVAVLMIVIVGGLYDSQRRAQNAKQEAERKDKERLERDVGKAREILDQLAAQTGVSVAAPEQSEEAAERVNNDTKENTNSSGPAVQKKVSVSVADLQKLLAIFAGPNERGQKISRESALVRASEALLSYRAGAEEEPTVLLQAEAELANVRKTNPADPELARRQVDVDLALGALAQKKLEPRSDDIPAIEAVKARYVSAKKTIDDFLATSTTNVDWLMREADCIDRLGDVSKIQGRVTDARSAYDKARSIREKMLTMAPGRAGEIQLGIARSWNKIGNSHYVDSPKEAIVDYHKALDTLANVNETGKNSDTRMVEAEELKGILYGNIGGAHAKMKKPDWSEIQNAYHNEVAIFQRLYQLNPGNLRWRRFLIESCANEAYYNILEVPKSRQNPELALRLAMKAVVLDDEQHPIYLIALRQAFLSFGDPAFRSKVNKSLKERIESWKATRHTANRR
jgi:Novel STAND NTPase 1